MGSLEKNKHTNKQNRQRRKRVPYLQEGNTVFALLVAMARSTTVTIASQEITPTFAFLTCKSILVKPPWLK